MHTVNVLDALTTECLAWALRPLRIAVRDMTPVTLNARPKLAMRTYASSAYLMARNIDLQLLDAIVQRLLTRIIQN